MVPTYEQEQRKTLGDLQAGLGNRYFSTFGQQTLQGAAEKAALSRAQLESDIYDSGQDAYNRLLTRATDAGNIASQAQEQYHKPATTIGSLLGVAGNNVANYNQSNSQNYAASMMNRRSGGGSGLATAAGLAGAVLPFIGKAFGM